MCRKNQSVYQQQLEPHGNSRYCDIILTAPNTQSGEPGPTAVLELLAMSMETDLRRHYNHALEYAESLKICSAQNGKSLYIWDIWIAHFTCGDGATKKENCMWPTEERTFHEKQCGTLNGRQWRT
ncbi:2315_t:CDS:2 [Paraglomus brasilianum]|uniref:2315_t:CDS:1 n=1 Tax=Paraglomus brasilianum TaxID=144538 RepID=A0A9N8ZHK2_9GLOM|nr:2315_t:CDS:2 [Paraglomus brasilianum]